jgi:Fic family protein
LQSYGQKILREPLLYLSLYFKTHRQNYYELLNNVRLTGDWEAWLHFIAEAVVATATQAVDTSRQLIDLANEDRDKISGLGRAAVSTLQVHRAMMERPITDSGRLVKKTGITPATVNKCKNDRGDKEISKIHISTRFRKKSVKSGASTSMHTSAVGSFFKLG